MIPTSLAGPLHNVDSAEGFEQIEWLGRFYDFMSVDDWFSAGRPAGKIAITVDDGYRCTLRNLVSALAAENIISHTALRRHFAVTYMSDHRDGCTVALVPHVDQRRLDVAPQLCPSMRGLEAKLVDQS